MDMSTNILIGILTGVMAGIYSGIVVARISKLEEIRSKG